MHLFPPVKSCTMNSDFWHRPAVLSMKNHSTYSSLSNLKFRFPMELKAIDNPTISVMNDSSFPFEGYDLSIQSSGIHIIHKDYNGLIYALFTLEQILLQYPENVPCLVIHDEPDLPIRGVLIDISRNKIPTLETLKELFYHLARFKINHVQLYCEGLSLEFPSQSNNYKEPPFTLNDYRLLDEFANHLGIDFVGNINTFGHMTDWLALPRYQSLAECPNGFKQWGVSWPPSTLNPLNPKSIELVSTLLDDFVPITTSRFFNINGDEPFELGRGKSKKVCQKTSVEQVYLDFMTQIINRLSPYDKIPMMWADGLIHHPSLAKALPPMTHVIDWGYDRSYDFASHAEALNALSIPFLLAPGTSTWNSFTGRFEDMRQTTLHAAKAAKTHHGRGLITTDWGDNGHLQYLPWSYIGFAYMALVAWSSEETTDEMVWMLDETVFHDETHQLTQAMIRLSTYNDVETTYVDNGTMLFQALQYVDTLHRFPYLISRLFHLKALQKHPLEGPAQQTINAMMDVFITQITPLSIDPLLKEELLQTVRWMQLCLMTHQWAQSKSSLNREAFKHLLDTTITTHERLWVARNLKSHLDESLKRIKTLRQFILGKNVL